MLFVGDKHLCSDVRIFVLVMVSSSVCHRRWHYEMSTIVTAKVGDRLWYVTSLHFETEFDSTKQVLRTTNSEELSSDAW